MLPRDNVSPGRRYGGKRAVLRGEHVISRKATAQGMSDVHRCPVCSWAHFLCTLAHETSGAARIRHSLRTLNFWGRNDLQNFGQIMPRECETVSSVILRRERSEPRRMNRPQ